MSSSWRESTWGEEISLEYGKGIRGYQDADGPVPVFGTNGQVGWTDEPLTSGPGIILGRKGAYRGIHYSKAPFFVIDTAYYVEPKSPLDMRWLYYAMVHHQLGSIDDGSPIPSTTRAAVYVRKLKVADDDTQRSVAKILGDLDDKIDLLREMNRTLEDIARAVFRAWFVDFEPVRAKAAGATSFRGMPQDLFDALPRTFDNTQAEAMPDGWAFTDVDAFFDVSIGRTPPRKQASHFVKGGDGVPWLSIKTMGDIQVFARSTEEDLTPEAVAQFRVPVIPKWTVLVSFKLTVGRVAISSVEMATNEAIAHLIPKAIGIPGVPYTYCYMREFDYARLGSTSSIATAVNSQSIRRMPFLWPGDVPLKHFNSLTQTLFDGIENNCNEIAYLTSIRDTLLPSLISGELAAPSLEALGLKAVGDDG